MTFFVRFLRAHLGTILGVIFFLVHITSLPAQERVRTSVGRIPIESFRRTPEAFFHLGPFQEELGGSVGVEYTDNVDLAKTGKISDLSFHQTLGLNTTWVLSHQNQLQFNFGGQLTEHFYGNGRSQTNFAITPDSIIQFQFAVSNVRVRLFDGFSYVQNPTTDPTATNTSNLNSLTNTIGAVVDADLNRAVLSFSADYSYNNESGTNVQGQTNAATTGDRQSFRVGSSVTFRWSPSILYGVNSTLTRSSGSHAANVNSLNVGPFINGKLSRTFEFDLAAGASLIDTKPAIPSGFYAFAAIRYLINRHWQLLASASHDLIFTTGTDLTEETAFRLGTQLDLTRFITVSCSPFYTFGDIKTSTQETVNTASSQGSFTQYGIEASLVWKPRKRWFTALTYDFIRRDSATAFQTGAASTSYIQNTLAFHVGYAF